MKFGLPKNEVAFLGVPYAAPPVGDLRWKPPQPVRHWNGTRKATEFGATCPQLPAGWRLGVVVSANYRLGPLGFFVHSAVGGVRTSFFWKLRSSRPTASAQMGAREFRASQAICAGSLSWVSPRVRSISACSWPPLRWRRVCFSGRYGKRRLPGRLQRRHPHADSIQRDFGHRRRRWRRLTNDLSVADSRDTLLKLRSIPADEILKAWNKDRKIHFDAIVDAWACEDFCGTLALVSYTGLNQRADCQRQSPMNYALS